ncbi:nitroreductase family protein [Microvirga lotononidis]|uniref:Putative NAD(P)H nitroreductase n=1 Tax=Microvirga lotononidis TaxID=864069 RepID=I4Z255_9HYPH|nr:nitroreductase [Microvirga lotononidis]EIM30297.1 nitroreductase [Microvirga lotononidis]WQO31142.1 nitroreductase [Microvirga lotononidis]
MAVSGTISDGNDPVRKAEGWTLLGHIIARRSTPPRHLTAPGPTDDEIQLLVRAASRAPDHQRLRPFRFLVINADERETLADVFEAAERELDPSIGGERLERAREKAHHAPVLLAVISRLQESDEVPEIEQRASAGAALGYVVLAADLLGYGAMAVSGRKVATAAMRHAFRLANNEELLCFVGLGTPRKVKGAPPEPAPELLQIWHPDAEPPI